MNELKFLQIEEISNIKDEKNYIIEDGSKRIIIASLEDLLRYVEQHFDENVPF
jgi:hypothetical protein